MVFRILKLQKTHIIVKEEKDKEIEAIPYQIKCEIFTITNVTDPSELLFYFASIPVLFIAYQNKKH